MAHYKRPPKNTGSLGEKQSPKTPKKVATKAARVSSPTPKKGKNPPHARSMR